MVPLPDLSARHFAHRIDIVHQAFITASIALKELVEEQRNVLVEYEKDVAAGLDPIEERDEDGHLLWTQDQLLQLRVDDASEALQSLHKATVISAYHVWEDATRRFTRRGNSAKHHDLVSALEDRRIRVHVDLDWIVLLVNLLKHGNPAKGRLLRDLQPDLFRPTIDPQSARTDWYDAVLLSSDVVELVIERLGQSGPLAHS